MFDGLKLAADAAYLLRFQLMGLIGDLFVTHSVYFHGRENFASSQILTTDDLEVLEVPQATQTAEDVRQAGHVQRQGVWVYACFSLTSSDLTG